MFRTILASVVLVSLAYVASAQDKILLTGNRLQEGTIVKVDADTVTLQTAAGSFALSRKDIVKVEIKRPDGLDIALKVNETRKYADVVPFLKAVTEKYLNIAEPWLEQAYATLGDCYMNLNQWPAALQVFQKIETYFPQSAYAIKAKIGRGLALVNEKKYDEALKVLEETTAPLRKELLVSPSDNFFLGKAMVAIGDCYAAQGKLDEALHSYLATVTLYWRDEDAVKQAQQKADQIKEQLKKPA